MEDNNINISNEEKSLIEILAEETVNLDELVYGRCPGQTPF